MKIEKIKENEIETVIALVQKSFDEVLMPREGNEEGRKSFLKVNTKSYYLQEDIEVYVAKEEEQIVGVLALLEHSQITLLYVDANYHRHGIGRKLVQNILKEAKNDIFVHSSLYGYPFFRNLGFNSINLLQEKDGVSYVPMAKRYRV